MNKNKYALAFVLFAALFACKGPAQEAAVQGSEAGPTATVKAVPIREAVLTEPVTAYGSVVPAPGSLFAISLPYDAKVLSVAVSEGEAVEAQERLVEVQGTPDARLALDEARLSEEAAGRAYQQMKVVPEGAIKSEELEKEHGKWIYSFDIQSGKELREVWVDAHTGEILQNKVESPDKEKAEAANEHE